MSGDGSLPLEQLDELERLCSEFEEAWKQGQPLDLRQFVSKAPSSIRKPLFKACLKLDCHYRRMRGEAVDPEFYRRRFPKHVEIVNLALLEPEETMPHLSEGTAPEADAAKEEVLPRKFGQYELLEKLGAGGMGVVYRANQFQGERVLRQVALKMIRPERLAVVLPEHREELLERFRIETENAASLEHDNIVRVYDVGEIDGVPYFTMAMIEGTSLHKLIRETTLDGKNAARILEPVARALEYAHQRQVVHRDIKPENILLDHAQTPYLADFGLAKALDVAPEVSVTGQVLGTPPYMSPEQVNGGDLDHRTDVYSLGATLYECLTGRPPFRAADFVQTLRQVIDQEPVAPRTLNRDIDRDMETICLKCLEKQPSKRYDSAEDFANDLGAYQRGEPIKARPISRPARAWRWCKRNSLVASLGATSICFLIVVAVVAIAGNRATEKALTKAEENLETSDHNLYFSKIQNARDAIRANNLGQAKEILAGCPERFRQVEWHYLQRLCHPELLTISGAPGDAFELQQNNVVSPTLLTFSPDARQLWQARKDGARCLEVKTGIVKSKHTFPPLPFQPVVLSPTQDFVVHSDAMWERSSGKQLLKLPKDWDEWGLAFSPTGDQVAFSVDWNQVVVKTLPSGEERRLEQPQTMGDRGVRKFVWSPNGKYVACGLTHPPDARTHLHVWNVGTGSLVCDVAISPQRRAKKNVAPAAMITDLAFHPSRNEIALALLTFSLNPLKSDNSSHVVTIDIYGGETTNRFNTDRGPFNLATRPFAVGPAMGLYVFGATSVTYSTGGDLLCVANFDRTITILEDGHPTDNLLGHAAVPVEIVCAPDNRTLASRDADGAIKIWSLRQRNSTVTYKKESSGDNPIGTYTTRDGAYLAVKLDGASGMYAFIERSTGDVKFTPSSPNRIDNRRFLLDAKGFDRLGKSDAADGLIGDVLNRSFDGEVIAVLSSDRSKVNLLSRSKATVLLSIEVSPRQATACWLPKNRTVVVTNGERSTIRDIDSGRLIGARDVKLTNVSLHGRHAIASEKNAGVYIATLPDFVQRRRLGIGRAKSSTEVTFSPDSTHLACPIRNEIQVVDLEDYSIVCSLSGEPQPKYARLGLCWTADGRRILWGSGIFDAQTGNRVLTMSSYGAAPITVTSDMQIVFRDHNGLHHTTSNHSESLLSIWRALAEPEENSVNFNASLEAAQDLATSAPANNRFKSALGAAQYRNGMFATAARTLEKSLVNADAEGIPRIAFAFLAMSQHKSGQIESAAETLRQFKRQWRDVLGARQLLLEAESLITGVDGRPKSLKDGEAIVGYVANDNPFSQRRWISQGDSAVHFLEEDTRRVVQAFKSDLERIRHRQVKISKDGRKLALVGQAKEGKKLAFELWDVPTGKVIAKVTANSSGRVIVDSTFSPDGSRFAILVGASQSRRSTGRVTTVYPNNPLVVYRLPEASTEKDQPLSSLPSVNFATSSRGTSPRVQWHGNLIACSNNIQSCVLNSSSGGVLFRQKEVMAITLSGDGKVLAVAKKDGGIVEFWSTAPFELQRRGNLSVNIGLWALSPSGETLANALSSKVHLWDTKTLKLMARLPIDRPVTYLGFDAAGRRLLCGVGDGRVQSFAVSPRPSK